MYSAVELNPLQHFDHDTRSSKRSRDSSAGYVEGPSADGYKRVQS